MDSAFGLKGARFTQARLRTILAALPLSTGLNPIGTAVAFIPFLESQALFGRLPWSHLVFALALQIVGALWAFGLYSRNRGAIADSSRLEQQLIVLQFAVSSAWGATIWLFWDPVSPVNHLYVALIMVTVVWNVLFTRMSHTPIFLAGVLPMVVAFWVRALTAADSVSYVLAQLLPIWATYIVMLGISGRVRVDAAFRTSFAKEDLTLALRESNNEAERKRFEAETANAAKTVFLANMSHELRTPLNAILGFSDIIARQALGPGEMARYSDYAADINASGTHLLCLINDLLDVAKIEAGKMEIDPQPLEAARVFSEIKRLMAPRAAARGQTIGYDVDSGLPHVLADERAFKQIVLNLLSNAVKFTPERGRITVAFRRAAEGGTLLKVEDSGPGIPPEKLESLFKPFNQIDNRYGRQAGGTGLGLALVKGLAALHGGRCWIESALGRGTMVFVYFPLAIEDERGRAVASG
ncbi:MAG: ATP-binding protein [Rhizomicrobium sp.]